MAGVVSEEGVSGYRDYRKRPRFQEVIDARADVVVVYRWSRLSRRKLDALQLIELLGRVESASESVDVSTAGGRMSRGMHLQIAEYESDVKSEQFKEAQARRIAAGLPSSGQARFGYRRVGRGFEPDPGTGPLLADMYRRYATGAGSRRWRSTSTTRRCPP